jgi:hypothetical protein
MLKQGKSSHASFITRLDQEDYIIKNESILNEKRCYHCHGKRDILGGISVLSSMVPVQQGIAGAEKTSFVIFLLGLSVIIFLIWLLFVDQQSKIWGNRPMMWTLLPTRYVTSPNRCRCWH